MEQNPELALAWQFIENTGTHLFLTGKAGTGKTTFLRRLKSESPKRMVVLAPTGIAAINAGGVTIHSFFQLPFAPYVPDTSFSADGKAQYRFRFGKDKLNIMRSIDLLVIDEISMVRADLLDAIDDVLRRFRDRSKPFGGVQLLMIGDLQQLAPVIKDEEWQMLNSYYDTPYFFSSRALRQSEYCTLELKTVYRQSDTHFLDMLNRIRENRCDKTLLDELNRRYIPNFNPSKEEGYIQLTTHNYQAQRINEHELAQLPGRSFTFRAQIDGKFPEYSYPTDEVLELKRGAQVMFVKNDSSGEHRYYNGMIGEVVNVSALGIEVRSKGSEDAFMLQEEEWTNAKYVLDEETKEITEDIEGVFKQFPLKLAWAITIHKSQGLTFSRVVIDFTGGVFAGGQAYVALSRCTSLDGIQLKKPVNRADVFVRPEIVNFAGRFNNRQAIDKALKQAQADVQYAAASRAFDKGDMEECLEQFFRAIHSRYDIEKPVPRRLIRRKLGIINTLKEQNKKLKEQMREQQERIRQYAHEYLLMGNECITQAHDVRAALANYDKALSLDPNYIDAWIRKGITLFNNKEYFDAENCFNTAVSLHPANFKAVYNRGKLRLKTENTEGAIADLDKATSLKPEHAGAHELFGDALLKAGKEVEAALQWRIAEELKKKKK